MNSIETIDLVHSYLTENRICGISRSHGYQGKHCLYLRHGRIELARITADATRAKVSSSWLKELSAGKNDTSTIELSDPQGLEQLVRLLEQITVIFNTFYKKLYLHKGALGRYITFPTDAVGEATLK